MASKSQIYIPLNLKVNASVQPVFAKYFVGNLALAAKLLGRPYSITGRVQYGDQIGRTLDFPTINVLVCHKPCLNGMALKFLKQLSH